MTATEFVSRFDRVERSGNGYKVRCPAHEDRKPSLAVSDGAEGKLLVHCHAGCAPDAVCRAAGIDVTDLFPESGRRSSPRDTKREVCRYECRDEVGVHLYSKVRYEPKDFSLVAANGVWALKGVRRVLYRLDHLMEERVVLVTEGEKDADLLAAWGFAATCNDDGAARPGQRTKWRDDYTRQILEAGASEVVVVPDHDEPGRAHAEAIATALTRAGLTVRVVTWTTGEKDVSDWAAAGHTADELRALIAAAPMWAPPTPEASGFAGSEPALLSFAELKQQPDPEWLIDGMFPDRGLAMIYGPQGAAKTTMCAALVGGVAAGVDVVGRRVLHPGPTLYVAAEDVSGFKVRLMAWARERGLDDLNAWTYPAAVPLLDPSAVSRLIDRASGRGIRLVIFDTYAASIEGGAENDSEVSSTAVAQARRVADALGCLVIVVHHSNAAGTKERGHSGVRGSCDTVIALTPLMTRSRSSAANSGTARPSPGSPWRSSRNPRAAASSCSPPPASTAPTCPRTNTRRWRRSPAASVRRARRRPSGCAPAPACRRVRSTA